MFGFFHGRLPGSYLGSYFEGYLKEHLRDRFGTLRSRNTRLGRSLPYKGTNQP